MSYNFLPLSSRQEIPYENGPFWAFWISNLQLAGPLPTTPLRWSRGALKTPSIKFLRLIITLKCPHRPQSKGSIATRFTNCVMRQLPRWMCVFRGQVDPPGSLLRHGLSRVRFLKLSVVEGSRLDNMVRTTSCRGFEAALRAGLL
jgi:hypothetical protein